MTLTITVIVFNRITYANEAALDLIHAKDDDLRGKNIVELLHPDDVVHFLKQGLMRKVAPHLGKQNFLVRLRKTQCQFVKPAIEAQMNPNTLLYAHSE